MNTIKFMWSSGRVPRACPRDSIVKKRNKKGTILIALMFLSVMSPKAWGYAQKELPSTSSEESFSSSENVYLSRAILTDENGVAICQVNLQENPEFLPGFAEAGSSDLKPLDLPECEEQNLDIAAEYAQQAWIKRDVAIAPLLVSFLGMAAVGCLASFIDISPALAGGVVGVVSAARGVPENIDSLRFLHAARGIVYSGGAVLTATALTAGIGAGVGAVSGLVCSGIEGLIFYQEESNE